MPGSPSSAPSAAPSSTAAPPPPSGWRALVQGERPVWILCGLLIVIGAFVRLYNLDLPGEYSFDERHFVKNARRYLGGIRDGNDHPPFGKLLISASLWTFGDNPATWRVPSLFAGWLNIGLAGALGRVLFRDRLAGIVAAALVAADGFFLVYSRTALLDGTLVSLMLGSALALSLANFGPPSTTPARRTLYVGIAAVLAGMACCVKFSGIVLLAPLVLTLLACRRALPRWAPGLLLLTPLTYGAIFAYALQRTGLPFGPVGVVDATRRLVDMHLGKSHWEHRWVSHWYTWFLPVRTVVMRHEREGNIVHAMVGIGNLAIWWGSELLVLRAFWEQVRGGPRALVARILGEPGPDAAGFFGVHARAIGWLCLLWLVPLTPWMVSSRDSYLYHYLPSYGFGAVLLAGGITWLLRTRARLGWLALAVVTAVFFVYLPLWIELPVTRWFWRTALFVKTWR